MRLNAWRLVNQIKKDSWKFISGPNDLNLTNEKLVIGIKIRRLRINDAVYVYLDGQEIWLPLLQRFRLRHFIRKLALRRAYNANG